MAKTIGPLMSTQASGSIAKQLTFRTGRGGSTCRQYARPTNEPTPAQIAHREQFALLAAAWNAASDADRSTWAPIATEHNISNYAAYTAENWRLLKAGRRPTTAYPPASLYRFYSGGTVTPQLSQAVATFQGTGSVSLIDNELWATPNLKTIDMHTATTLDGVFDFGCFLNLITLKLYGTQTPVQPQLDTLPALNYADLSWLLATEPPDLSGCPNLTILWLEEPHFTTPPILTVCPKLVSAYITTADITQAPDLSGLTALLNLSLANDHLAEVDSIYNWAAENLPHNRAGVISTAGPANAAVTAASLAARTALAPPNGTWTLSFNS